MSEQNSTQRWLVPHLPTDPELLAAIGRVAISHSFLDFVLKRTIKTLARLNIEQGDRDYAYHSSKRLRTTILTMATAKFGATAAATLTLTATLATCKALTLRRNKLMHGLCARYDDEVVPQLFAHDSITPMPAAAEINQLAGEIWVLAHQINNSRIEPGGFIYDAMQASEGSARINQTKNG